MVFGRNEGGSSRHRQSIKGGPKKIHFQLAVNEQGVCVHLCVCMCVDLIDQNKANHDNVFREK